MAGARHFRELECWQLARELKLALFRFVETPQVKKDFKFYDQVREAAATAGFEERAERAAAEIKEETREAGREIREQSRAAGREIREESAQAGRAVADAAITSAVKAKFLADTTVKGLRIDVDTDAGVVTLNGTVSSRAEADRAMTLARNTEGVKRVVDNMKVGRY